MLIDVLSALSCQIVGIDPSDPNTPCLTVNPETHKIGYAKQDDKQLGGMIGVLTDQIGVLYTPAASSGQYVSYMANNFGLVKPAIAADVDPQQEGVGFAGLQPIFELWKIILNLAYLLLVLVFIFIGLAVMLRIKIDPRTVMTVQNQIPRVVICIILITLSYALSGLMIDMMWTSTYVGINAIAQGPQDVALPCIGGNNGPDRKLSTVATSHLLDTPISYFNQVFHSQDDGVSPTKNCDTITRGFSGGIFHVTQAVSRALGGLVRDVITSLLGTGDCNPVKGFVQVATFGLFGTGEAKDCASKMLGEVFGFLANIVTWLIILVAILISLFRIWFKLIQAYIHIIFYVIAAPVWIVMGLIPGRPLGFENWMRNMFANLAVFPLTAGLFVAARIFMDVFDVQDNNVIDPSRSFIPPLVGNPNMEVFGTIMAFGVVLMAPGLLDLIKEKMKAQGTKIGGLATATIVAATGAASAMPKRQWASLTAKDQYGNATGPVSTMSQQAGRKIATGKYAPWNLKATYKRALEKSQGKPETKGPISFMEKRQEKKEMARQGYGYMTADQYENRYGEKPNLIPGQRKHPHTVNKTSSPAGQGDPDTQAVQQPTQQQHGQQHGQQQGHQQGQQQRPPQSLTGNTAINQGQPKLPIMPGGSGTAKTLPERDIRKGHLAQGPINNPALSSKLSSVGNVAPKMPQDIAKSSQASKLGALNVSTLNVGKLNVSGNISGKGSSEKHVTPDAIQHPWKAGMKDAAKSAGEGWKNLGKAENEMVESSRGSDLKTDSSGQITDIGQAAAQNELKTRQMAEAFAERMSKYQEHSEEAVGESTQITKIAAPTTQEETSKSEAETPSMHPGGQAAPTMHNRGGHVTAEDIDRQAHANKADISAPESHATTEPHRESEKASEHPGGQTAPKPAAPKPEEPKK